jgi:hypothetical protein
MKDAVFLVADKDMEQTLLGLLTRHQSFGITAISRDIYIHPQRDPGCWNDAVNFLRPYVKDFRYAFVLFDYHGSGQDEKAMADDLQSQLEEQLAHNGWENRARVIVLVPELEAWVWGESPKVDEILNWKGKTPDLRSWLESQQIWGQDESNQRLAKPSDPKLALDRALRQVQKPHSSAVFRSLAEQVSFKNCVDASFLRFKNSLIECFAITK